MKDDGSNEMQPNEDARFAKAVTRYRTARGWSQSELARQLHGVGLTSFHQNTVSRVEKGERPVKLSEAAAFARVFDTTVADLVRVYVTGVEALSTSLVDLRDSESRLEQAYEDHKFHAMVVSYEVQKVQEWVLSKPSELENAGNRAFVDGLISAAEEASSRDCADVVAALTARQAERAWVDEQRGLHE